MVNRKNVEKKYALISVYNKTNLSYLCNNLKKHSINFISTGSTCKKIKKLGFRCQEISSLTKFKEILDGRVKTLHPKIHASLLFKRNNPEHLATFKKLNFPVIDYVIVNLYPFKKTIKNTTNKKKIIEMIDIGGPTLLRSSSKNFDVLTTICDPSDYSKFIKNLDKNKGNTSYEFRKKMAFKVFKNTSHYDSLIFKWLKSTQELKNKGKSKKILLKYGENPNQKSFFIKNNSKSIFDGQIQGNKIGYNNILDINEGLACLKEFKEPTCIIIKHNNPCGVASDTTVKKSFIKAYQADSLSAFGGVVLFNRKINKNLSFLLKKYFFEIIVAPDFEKNSIEIFKTKKNLILIRSNSINSNNNKEFKTVTSGILFQNKNDFKITRKSIKLVSSKGANFQTVEDLLFAFKVVKHVKSNAIVLANKKQTVGIGAGQMSRFDSTRLALMKYKDYFANKKFVCASDAFFPFVDNIQLLKKNNCLAIIQPLGSKNDKKIIDFAKQNKIPLYFTKNRVFKH